MNLQQLYYFQAISRLKNYTKAAEQLLVAQSSLSHSVSWASLSSSRWGGILISQNTESSS